jgi:thiol-disulfide isomerase/thioredoxin
MGRYSGLFRLVTLLATVLPATSQVQDLTDQQLWPILAANDFVFLKVYSKKCSHCKSAEAPFLSASKKFYSKNVKFVDVDGDKYSEVMKRLGISGFPGMFFFSRGFQNRLQYFGPVSEEKYFTEFLGELVGRISPKLYQKSEVEALAKTDDYTGYGLFCGSQDSQAFKVLQTHIVLCHEMVYFTTEELDVCQEHQIGQNGFAFRRISGHTEVLQDLMKTPNLKRHIIFMKYDPTNPFKKEFFVDSIEEKLPIVVFADRETSGSQLAAVRDFSVGLPAYTAIVLHNRLQSEFESEYFPLFEAKESDLPLLWIVEMKQPMKKIRYQGKWDPKAIRAFFDAYQAKSNGNQASGKSKDADDGPVLLITKEKMLPFLNDKSVSKLILFYTDECTGCQHLQETLTEVGAHFKAQGKAVRFGKVDTNENDLPNIKKVPAVVFFGPDFQKDPEFFKGEGTKENLVRFVTEKLGTVITDDL